MNLPLALTYDDIAIKPLYSEVQTRKNCNLLTNITENFELTIPICSSPMDTVTEHEMATKMNSIGGIGFIHRFMSIQKQVEECNKVIERGLKCGAAIGTKGDFLERVDALWKIGVRLFVIDTAHGHHILVKNALNVLNTLKKNKRFDILVGSIVTKEAARDLISWGANGLRCGISNGSLCTTRDKAAVGYPQVSALLEVCEEAHKHGIPVCADGGIRKPSDAAKAIALGASTVMLGSLLAATDESPGEITKIGKWPNEQLFKKYQGSASADSKKQRGEDVKNVEGQSKLIPYKGSVNRIIEDICEGIRSNMSYLSSLTILDLWNNANGQFIQITNAGHIEGSPHLMMNE